MESSHYFFQDPLMTLSPMATPRLRNTVFVCALLKPKGVLLEGKTKGQVGKKGQFMDSITLDKNYLSKK